MENESREISGEMDDMLARALAISRMTPVLRTTSRRTTRMKSRLRIVAGAFWRSSLIFFTDSGNFGSTIADASSNVANQSAVGHSSATAAADGAGLR